MELRAVLTLHKWCRTQVQEDIVLLQNNFGNRSLLSFFLLFFFFKQRGKARSWKGWHYESQQTLVWTWEQYSFSQWKLPDDSYCCVSFTLEFRLFSCWDEGDFELMVQLAQGHWSFAGGKGARVGLSIVDEECHLPYHSIITFHSKWCCLHQTISHWSHPLTCTLRGCRMEEIRMRGPR